MKNDNIMQKGQALLLVLLTMGVMVVVSLSVVSRSVTDVEVATSEEESLRAFSAAEAGVEEALLSNLTPGQTVTNTLSGGEQEYDVAVTSASSTTSNTRYIYPFKLANGDSAIVWFTGHSDSGNLSCDTGVSCYAQPSIGLCWGEPHYSRSSPTTPAVEVTVVYQNGSDFNAQRFAYDVNSTRRGSNNFATTDYATSNCPSSPIDGRTFLTGKNINLSVIPNYSTPGTLKFMIVKMLYNSDQTHPVAFYSNSTALPPQAIKVKSTGKTSGTLRTIDVVKLYPEMPPMFEAALYSQTDLIK